MTKAVRGLKRCTATIHREYEAAARAALAQHPSVLVETIHCTGGHLSFSIDLARIDDGAGPCVEGVILGDIEKACRP